MEWHIITGSKGGVGKTLLSLLLVAHCLEDKKRKEGSTLILDLNGMNADSSALLLYRAAAEKKSTTIQLDTQVTLYHQNADEITFQTAYTDDSKGQSQQYIIGWPANPFMLMNPQLFADLLRTITVKVSQIEKDLDLSSPLRHIIIDTNYHFCNIFGQDDRYYPSYTEGDLRREEINIWFLWVYRQLEKIMGNSNEGAIIRATAVAIEKNLTRRTYCPKRNATTPLLHVFTPAALMTSSGPFGILERLTAAMATKKDYVIPEFEILEKSATRECVKFMEWVTALHQAYNAVLRERNEERAALFPEVLIEAIKRISSPQGNQRPRNVIPLSVHQPTLQHYTDKERPNAVANLRTMKIYKEHLAKYIL